MATKQEDTRPDHEAELARLLEALGRSEPIDPMGEPEDPEDPEDPPSELEDTEDPPNRLSRRPTPVFGTPALPSMALKPALLWKVFAAVVREAEGTPSHKDYRRSYQRTFGLGNFRAKGAWHLAENTLVHQLSRQTLRELIRARLDEGAAPSSINLELKVLRKVWIYAAESNTILVDRSFKVKLLRARPKSRFLSEKEEDQVLRELNRYHNQRRGRVAFDLMVCLLDTGCRISELLAVRLEDVDFDKGYLKIFRKKVAKSANANALLYMTQRCRTALLRRFEDDFGHSGVTKASVKIGKFTRDLHKGFAFTQPRGGIDLLRTVLDDTLNQDPTTVARHGTATLHTLRDTFASRLLTGSHKARLMIPDIGALLGHSNAAMTEKYAHLICGQVSRKAVDILEDIYKSRK